jgi:predicted acetyltransferase
MSILQDQSILEFLQQSTMIDGDLKLHFLGKTITTPPDTILPVYKFMMVNSLSGAEMGGITLREGYTDNVILYRGNIGFTVNENFRGNHYAARSCILLLPLIRMIGLNPVWLTCNVDNIASKKSIERIGATYVDTVTIPKDSPYYQYYPEGSKTKLRYRWEI